jgi:chromosome segregation protein
MRRLLPLLLGLLAPLALKAAGADLYRIQCSACHGPEGKGIPGVFPPLAGADFLRTHREQALRAPMEGLQGALTVNGQTYHGQMPSVALKNAQMVELFDFIFTSWGNDLPKTSLEEIKTVRARTRYPTFEQLVESMCPQTLPAAPAGWLLRVALPLAFNPTRVIADPDGHHILMLAANGDVWRWDGLMARAEAPSGAAKRLAEKNRLHTLESQLLEAHKVRHLHQSALENLQNEIRTLTRDEADAFQALQSAQKQRENARNAFTQFEREQAGISSRILHLNETAQRLEKSITQSEQRLFELQNDLTQLETSADDETKLHDARLNVANARDLASQTRTQLQAFIHDQTQKRARRDALQRDISAWQNRFENAQQAVESWHTRLTALEAEQATLLEAPQTFLITRRTLLSDITEAEQARRKAADKLNAAQLAQAHHQREAKNALETLSQAREAKITADVRFEAAMSKREDMIAHIDEALKITPAALLIQTQKMLQDTKPVPATLETQLNRLKREREEMGGVNLRAEEELNESQLKKDQLVQERDDLIEAIRRLRGGIGNLNREGRERLLAAFETVNNHFGTLFTHLFGGGSAHLKLIESDDPLEAGLEIIAHPPGKKPQILTLLSGGEQALTATALIFAVFLTNPSPICVLDEVDAPLDDANVARYCDLLDDMVSRTDTRFLVITHNPITMSRMNRLYGVTMMERGVSMVLSVNLDQAQDMAEAG